MNVGVSAVSSQKRSKRFFATVFSFVRHTTRSRDRRVPEFRRQRQRRSIERRVPETDAFQRQTRSRDRRVSETRFFLGTRVLSGLKFFRVFSKQDVFRDLRVPKAPSCESELGHFSAVSKKG